MEWINGVGSQINNLLSGIGGDAFSYFTMIIRFVLPLLALIVIVRCARSLLRGKTESEEWGYMSLPNGARIPLRHWENIIGRSRGSDVLIEYPSLSRTHAAVIRSGGVWRIYDLQSKSGVIINGREADLGAAIKNGDEIMLGGIPLVFIELDSQGRREQAGSRRLPGRAARSGGTLFLLMNFQLLLGLQLCIARGESLEAAIPSCFAALIALMWLCYILTRLMRRRAFEVETLAFFLCSIGMAVTATSAPGYLYKQLGLLIAAVALYFIVGWFLRDLTRVKRVAMPTAFVSLLLLAVNLLLSKVTYGARNWLSVGGISFQPSEFVKIGFIFVGAATLDKLFTRRSLTSFILFAGVCVTALALMDDFGSALIFFATYLVIAFLRSGDLATVLFSVAGAGLAGVLALTVRPHIASRFATWGRVWELYNSGGYQQSRTMSAAASGGLFGVGAGNGWLKRVFAADTDMVFGVVSEELGLIVALAAVASVVILAVFAVRSASTARSSFYIIASCAASTFMLAQLALNVLGSVDILPFTGVTFPFVSKGGSSLMACWGLLAFIKAGDTRPRASFSVRLPKRVKTQYEPVCLDEPYRPEEEE